MRVWGSNAAAITRITCRPASVGSHNAALDTDQAVATKGRSNCQFFSKFHIRRGNVEVDPERAHQAFDGAGALLFSGIEPATAATALGGHL